MGRVSRRSIEADIADKVGVMCGPDMSSTLSILL